MPTGWGGNGTNTNSNPVFPAMSSKRDEGTPNSNTRILTPILLKQQQPAIKQIFFEEVKTVPVVHAVAPPNSGGGGISWSQEIRRRATVALSR